MHFTLLCHFLPSKPTNFRVQAKPSPWPSAKDRPEIDHFLIQNRVWGGPKSRFYVYFTCKTGFVDLQKAGFTCILRVKPALETSPKPVLRVFHV